MYQDGKYNIYSIEPDNSCLTIRLFYPNPRSLVS